MMPNPNPRSPIEPGQQLEGKYRVEREIGAGAMGVVVEAWHVELEQRVAIKFLHPELAGNEDGAERFRREARAAVRIESEHVAKVIDIGVLEPVGIPYYVMEYLPGQDLARELEERGPLPASQAVDYVLQACDALAEAHGKGIVHRDLKPANLFLAQRPSGARIIKVLDFGISKITNAGSRQVSLTDTSTLMGSPAYMSPEQLESSRDVDGRADIWSLGVILHELIAGQLPFRGDSVPQLVRSVLTGGRQPLTGRGDVPPALDDVVARCLEQNREERFASIEKLREALLPYASAAAPAVGVSTTPGVAPDLGGRVSPLPGKSRLASPAVASPRLGADRHSGSAPTSWGHTQRGRGWRAVSQRGLGVAAVFAALSVAGYWVLRSSRPRVEPPANRPPPEVAASAPPAAPAPAPIAAEEPASVAGPAASAATLSPPPQPEAEPAAAARAVPPRAPIEARVLPKRASAPAPPAANPAPPPSAAAAEPTRAVPEAPAHPEAAAQPATAPPAPARKLDIPDFGGRE